MVELLCLEIGNNFVQFSADTSIGSIKGIMFSSGEGKILFNNTTLARPFWPEISYNQLNMIRNLKSWVEWQERLNN